MTQCAKPSITVIDGELTFGCETENVTFHTYYNYNGGNGNAESNKVVLVGTVTCTVTVYASKEGYLDSENASSTVELNVSVKGDVDGDGKVDVADHVELTKIIMGE